MVASRTGSKSAYTPFFTLLKINDDATITVRYDGSKIPSTHKIQKSALIVTSDGMDSNYLNAYDHLNIGEKYRAQCCTETGYFYHIQIADVIPMIYVGAKLVWDANEVTVQAVSNGSVCITFDEDGEMDILHNASVDQLKPRPTAEDKLADEMFELLKNNKSKFIPKMTKELCVELVNAGYRKVVTDDNN